MSEMISSEAIASRIYFIHGVRVMLDRDLAELYGVETKVLKQAVRRNIARFPSDFMFEMSTEEFPNLRSQIVTSSWGGAWVYGKRTRGAIQQQALTNTNLNDILKM